MDIAINELEKIIKEEINDFLDEKLDGNKSRRRRDPVEDWMFPQDISKGRRRERESEAAIGSPQELYARERGRPLELLPDEKWKEKATGVEEFEENIQEGVPIGTEKVVGTKTRTYDTKTGKMTKCKSTGQMKCPPEEKPKKNESKQRVNKILDKITAEEYDKLLKEKLANPLR